jgi:AraC-like DNA-binding protein
MRMEPIEKALWFIENRLSGEISLADVARSVGVSSHHLARAFGEATGLSLMGRRRGSLNSRRGARDWPIWRSSLVRCGWIPAVRANAGGRNLQVFLRGQLNRQAQ